MSPVSEEKSRHQQQFTARKACLQDATALSELGTYVFSHSFGYSVTEQQLQTYLDESYSVQAQVKEIADPNKDLFVAVDSKDADGNGSIIGFALLNRASSEPCVAHLQNTVELQRIYVHPDFQSCGVGRLLATTVEDAARQRGHEHIWLGVWEENVRSQKVYEKLGFANVGMHQFVIGGEVQHDHIMLKQL